MASVVADRLNAAISEPTTDDAGCEVFPLKYSAVNIDRLVPTLAYGSRSAAGNWSGAIGDLLSDRAQVGVGLFPVSPQLVAAGLQYSTPILSTGFTTLTRLQQAETDPWAFLKPFSLQLWLAICGTLALAAVILWATDKVNPFGFHNTQGHPEERRGLNLFNSLWNGWLVFTGKNSMAVQSVSARWVILGLMVAAMFLLKAYIASLTSILVSRDLRLAVAGWQDVSARGLAWGLVAQSPTQSYLASSSDPRMQALLAKAVVFNTFDDAVAALRQGKIPALISESIVIKFSRMFPPCELAVAGDEFGSGYVGFAFAASVPPSIVEGVNYAIGQVRSNGDADVMYGAYFAAPGSCADTPASTTLQDGLGLPELSGVFYAGFILVGAAIVLLGVEWLLWRCRNAGALGTAVNKGIGCITPASRANALKTEQLFLQPVPVPAAPALCK